MLRRLPWRSLSEWGAAIPAELPFIRTAVRDRVRPPTVVPRKEATYEGITFRVPAEYDGTVWDDIGLRVSLHADTLEPLSTGLAQQEKRGLDVVQVFVRWEDRERISAWVRGASAPHEQGDAPDNGGAPASAGLRRFRAPQGGRAIEMFLPHGPRRSTADEDTRPEVILRVAPRASPAPVLPGILELRPGGAQPDQGGPRNLDCEFFVPFRHLRMTLAFDGRHLARWREMRDAALALVNSMVVDGGAPPQR